MAARRQSASQAKRTNSGQKPISKYFVKPKIEPDLADETGAGLAKKQGAGEIADLKSAAQHTGPAPAKATGDPAPAKAKDKNPSKGRKGRKQVVESSGDELSGSGSDWGKMQGDAVLEDATDDGSDVSMVASDAEQQAVDEDLEEDCSPASAKAVSGTAARKAKRKLSAVHTPAPAKAAARKSSTGAAPSTRPTPATAASDRARVRQSLDQGAGTPLAATPAAGGPLDQERYTARAAARFDFMQPEHIRDARRRRPDHPDYDPSTLHIPDGWFKQHKVSEGQQQWWRFKSEHFDCVLLFKQGKFLEMYEMDAHTGVEVLGLSYMKGEQPHAGFPEKNYQVNAERLVRAGFKVAVVEQTETPELLKARNEQRKADKLPAAKVVNRELVAVLTRGTLTDPEMLAGSPDPAYIMAVVERPPLSAGGPAADAAAASDGPVCIGVCVVDAAAGRLMLGQWNDDELRVQLRTRLASLQPAELVLPKHRLSTTTRRLLAGVTRGARTTELPAGPGSCWVAGEAMQRLQTEGYFSSPQRTGEDSAMPDAGPTGTWPAALQALLADGEQCSAAIGALGGAVAYLKQMLLDRSVLPSGRMELLPGCGSLPPAAAEAARAARLQGEAPCLALDGAALANLEVLESSQGDREGSLLAYLDHCASAAGRRCLAGWLCRPLAQVKDILARQDAVADLMQPHLAEAVGAAQKAFKGVGDLDRSLARLHATGLGGAMGRDAAHVVLYEDQGKRRVSALAGALQGLQALDVAVAAFQPHVAGLTSQTLQRLLTPGQQFPAMAAPLQELQAATDWDEAASTGRVVPAEGVDQAFDAAEAAIADARAMLDAHLADVQRLLGGGKEVSYISLNKEPFVLEVSESLARKVPAAWELAGQRKGWKRYMSPWLRTLVAEHAAALQAQEKALGSILQGLLHRFAGHASLWTAALEAMAHLDALMSLAAAAQFGGDAGQTCRPAFVQPGAGQAQVFNATALRHPAAELSLRAGGFVPNNVQLGGDAAPFIVLTGPNMGGKSTLLRQVCLATILAQAGAWVPAESLTLSPVDAVYVRMGARDAIMQGQSTFFVELSETAAALNRATPASLVALDELGRGTATFDGAAIAGAVLEHLSSKVRCRGLFATHYHRLADTHAGDPAVAIKHMGCVVKPSTGSEGRPDQVTFLYTLEDGACPKSHGVNVALMAGLPEAVVTRAAGFSADLEQAHERQLVRRQLPAAARCLEGCGMQELLAVQARLRGIVGAVQT